MLECQAVNCQRQKGMHSNILPDNGPLMIIDAQWYGFQCAIASEQGGSRVVQGSKIDVRKAQSGPFHREATYPIAAQLDNVPFVVIHHW